MVKTEVYLDFNETLMGQLMKDGTLDGCRIAAEELVEDAEKRFVSKAHPYETGLMRAGFFDFKTKFNRTAWIAGVFGKAPSFGRRPPTPGRRKGPEAEWEDSIGGRAHFFEYGRSIAGFGRASNGKAMTVSARRKWAGNGAQPPRPFIRPAKNKIKRKLGGITSKELQRVARRLNRSPSLNSRIMSQVNRIA